jgi:hypothetical protein
VIIPVSEIAQQRTVRLIPAAFYKPPVLQALVDSHDELDVLARLEGLTSKRLGLEATHAPIEYDRWGRTFISAAFAYCREGGNRFNDGKRGAWYAGFEERTALHEVAFHKTRELRNINHFHETSDYRALHASFIGRFHDIRTSNPMPECLHPDPEIGYRAGQTLAKSLIEEESRGLIYPSVRYSGGTCIAAFQPNVVQDVVPGANWRIVWNGSPTWQATAL